jgi:menaquinone-dependent protoporphyrinogen oxidase
LAGKRALVVYGTRFGGTRGVADEIGRTLGGEGFEVDVVDAKQGALSVEPYSLVVVGSGIMMGKWTGEAEGFLRRNSGALKGRRLAMFVSCGSGDRGEDWEKARREYIDAVAARNGVSPSLAAVFGGVYDFKGRGLFGSIAMWGMKKEMEKRGVDTGKPYDFRDWDRIREWAREAARLSAP